MLPATRICPPQVISLAAVTVPVKLGLARGASKVSVVLVENWPSATDFV